VPTVAAALRLALARRLPRRRASTSPHCRTGGAARRIIAHDMEAAKSGGAGCVRPSSPAAPGMRRCNASNDKIRALFETRPYDVFPRQYRKISPAPGAGEQTIPLLFTISVRSISFICARRH